MYFKLREGFFLFFGFFFWWEKKNPAIQFAVNLVSRAESATDLGFGLIGSSVIQLWLQ